MNQETEERTVNLRVRLPDAQIILNSLSERPHREVSRLIPEIMRQIQMQLNPPADEPAPAESSEKHKTPRTEKTLKRVTNDLREANLM